MNGTEIKKLSNIDLLALIRTVSLELENRECEGKVTKYVAREIPSTVCSPNQQRAKAIQRARSFVKVHGMSDGRFYYSEQSLLLDGEFIVNDKKRRVVCLLRGTQTRDVYARGVAKCMPGDVFNADIGKAIALAKALQIDIPKEFMDAVQPDEVVIGMRVEWTGSAYHYPGFTKEIKPPGWYSPTGPECAIDSVFAENATILDDTNAEYEFESVGD